MKAFPTCSRALVLVLALQAEPLTAGDEAPLDLKKLFQEGIPRSPFIAAVYKYADAMLAQGRDVHGARSTGLFLSALDRTTLSHLQDRPPAPTGVRETARPGRPGGALVGANLQLDQNLLRLLLFLRTLSGEDRYEIAAHEALAAFIEECASAETGLLPWGASLYWDTIADQPGSGDRDEVFLHGFSGPWLLWEELFTLAPEASARAARAILTHHTVDLERGELRAYAPFGSTGAASTTVPDSAGASARHEGFLLRTCAEAHAATKDESFATLVDAVLRRHERREQVVESTETAAGLLSLAIDADGAARRLPEPLRSRLHRLAARIDGVFTSLPHDLPGKHGFLNLRGASAEARAFTPLWDPSRGPTTALLGVLCMARYQNSGRVEYRDLLVSAADAYLDVLPGSETDAWPLTFGQVITLELAAYRATSHAAYFDRAFGVGELALAKFFDDGPLPRASLRSEHYESTTGAPTLALALAELHLETLDITAVRTPANTADR